MRGSFCSSPLAGDWYSSHRERLGLVELLAEGGGKRQLALFTCLEREGLSLPTASDARPAHPHPASPLKGEE
ncbi:hypothetical protein GCM10025871_10850 [Deinococcus metallilatus]|nr:hypothetical protein GCM10025871_10850 [Deinococcus metallilatus]